MSLGSLFYFPDEEFEYIWKIDHLRYCFLPKGKSIKSPKFTLLTFENTTWHLNFYPNGCKQSSDGFISCYLRRESGNLVKSGIIEINFKLSIGSVSNNITHSFPVSGRSWGFTNYLPIGKNSDYVIIKCIMRMCPDKYPLKKVTQKILRETVSFPCRCLARSVFVVEKNFMIWPIHNYIYEKGNELVIPVYSLNKSTEIVVKLQKTDANGKDTLAVQLHLPNINTMKNSILLVCKMCVVDSGNEIINATEEKHVFNNNEAESQKWELLHSLDISVLKQKLRSSPSTKLNLYLQFEFAFGEVQSNITWETNYHPARFNLEFPLAMGRTRMQALRFYYENNCCDAVIRVKNQTYYVHKTLLCAWSHVFTDMFAGSSAGSEPYTVDINDVDETTMDKLISYLYLGEMECLNFDSATELFTAATKFEILSLIKLCRNFIINNLDVQNICKILLRLKSHFDSRLRYKALRFVWSQKGALLLSPEWKEFEKQNSSLAIEIYRDLCLQRTANVLLLGLK